MQKGEERTLIESAKTDPQAFGILFDTYYQKILAFAIRRTNSVAAAEEIVSETFLKAYKHLPRFQWRGVSIEAWLFKIAVNELRMQYRRQSPRSSFDELRQHEASFQPDTDVALEAIEAQEKLARHQQFMQAQKLISMLPPKYQDVLLLRFVEHKKISEIAHIVGKKEGTVKSLLSRGIARLRKELSDPHMQPNTPSRIIRKERNN